MTSNSIRKNLKFKEKATTSQNFSTIDFDMIFCKI